MGDLHVGSNAVFTPDAVVVSYASDQTQHFQLNNRQAAFIAFWICSPFGTIESKRISTFRKFCINEWQLQLLGQWQWQKFSHSACFSHSSVSFLYWKMVGYLPNQRLGFSLSEIANNFFFYFYSKKLSVALLLVLSFSPFDQKTSFFESNFIFQGLSLIIPA